MAAHRSALFVVLSIAVVGVTSTPTPAAALRGDYVEARTADVWTGPCFANGQVNLAGREAILGWRIAAGSWNGTSLEGLSVVVAVRTDTTLGDPFATPTEKRAVVLVDERANASQRAALADFACRQSGGLVAPGAPSIAVPIAIEADLDAGRASLDAGGLAEIRTRPVGHCDRHCGNEEVYYEPLSAVRDPVAAVALVSAWRGEGLGATWTERDKRSAFVGRFEQ